jgi:hypothetical protein
MEYNFNIVARTLFFQNMKLSNDVLMALITERCVSMKTVLDRQVHRRRCLSCLQDLVAYGSSYGKNWRGVTIALLVIAIICAFIGLAIVLVTPGKWQHETGENQTTFLFCLSSRSGGNIIVCSRFFIFRFATEPCAFGSVLKRRIIRRCRCNRIPSVRVLPRKQSEKRRKMRSVDIQVIQLMRQRSCTRHSCCALRHFYLNRGKVVRF